MILEKFIFEEPDPNALAIPYFQVLFVCLFVVMFVCLRLYVPVDNFSVMLGRLPGFNQY